VIESEIVSDHAEQMARVFRPPRHPEVDLGRDIAVQAAQHDCELVARRTRAEETAGEGEGGEADEGEREDRRQNREQLAAEDLFRPVEVLLRRSGRSLGEAFGEQTLETVAAPCGRCGRDDRAEDSERNSGAQQDPAHPAHDGAAAAGEDAELWIVEERPEDDQQRPGPRSLLDSIREREERRDRPRLGEPHRVVIVDGSFQVLRGTVVRLDPGAEGRECAQLTVVEAGFGRGSAAGRRSSRTAGPLPSPRSAPQPGCLPESA